MFGWVSILAGLGSFAKESYNKNRVKYSSPEAERYFRQADNDNGVPLEERNRRRMEGYYDRKVK